MFVRSAVLAFKPAPLRNICRAPAVRSIDTIGCGFKTTGIQRFKQEGMLWIPVLQQDQADGRLKGQCQFCGHPTQHKKDFCSMSCRGHIVDGAGVPIMQRLVDFAQVYTQPSILLDRFCRVRFRAYSSECCPEHLVHHQGAQHDAAAAALGEDVIINIERVGGWPAINGAGLPAAFVHEVQELHVDDGDGDAGDVGEVFYPLQSRPLDQLNELQQDDPESHPCEGINCGEVFTGDMRFCSLRCRHVG